MRTHHSLGPAFALAFLISAGGEMRAAVDLPIFQIQGAGHTSPHLGTQIRTRGCVTARVADGFYLQDAVGDGNPHTSDGIFVFTNGAPAPSIAVGAFLQVEALVVEFRPGGPASNNLTITRLENAVTSPAGPPLPATKPLPVLLGSGGRLPPGKVVDNDNFLDFDPEEDGIDFFESLEGMLVALPSPLVVCPSNPKAELYVVVEGGAGASGMSKRGTLHLAPDDYNPERIQIQETPRASPGMENGPVKVGDLLDDVTGVMSYDGMYEVLTFAPVTMQPGPNSPQTTTLLPYPERLRIASYQVSGLDPKVEDPARTDPTASDSGVDDDLGSGRYDVIAAHLVTHLRAPDLIALQGVQDDDGAELTATTRATKNLLLLTGAIFAAGGPTYYTTSIDPAQPAILHDNGTPGLPGDDYVVNPSGGQAGGNQRIVFLYNPSRVSLVPGSTLAVQDPDLSDGDAFGFAPHPLLATFLFNGEEITLLGVHFSERIGGASVFGSIQPATDLQEDPTVNGGVDRRRAQAAAVRDVTEAALASNPNARFVVLGDFNESEFLSPTLALGTRFTNLTETLEHTERYTSIAEGNSLALDHVFVNRPLMKSSPRCEVVHLNCEFADPGLRGSDRDPVLASLAVHDPFAFEARTIDGVGNNLLDPAAGRAGHHYLRTSQGGVASFADLLNYPRGSSPGLNSDPLFIRQSNLPSARAISNALSKTPTSAGLDSAAGLSSWTWQWGQFIDHDFGLSGGPDSNAPREYFPIAVPAGDPDFDPFNTGTMIIPFGRSGVAAGTGLTSQRETPNLITSFLDGSGVYGSDELRALNLRALTGGRLLTQPGPDGDLPPFNLYRRSNANDLGLAFEGLLLAGDVRANEQCALTAAHALFVREHNRLAAEIAARDFPGADPADPHLDAELYARARKFVGALIQNITYHEFLPAILGPNPLPAYSGYDDTIDPSISQEFANGAYRVGHTMVTPVLLRFDAADQTLPAGHLPLRFAFFNPPEVTGIGIDPYLRGLARQVQQEIDRFVIDDLRSFMFGPPGAGGLDLAALNIQRGRDHGIPPLNAVRASLGLPVAATYRDIISEPAAAASLEALYLPGKVDQVDLWIGGVCEDHVPGSQLGMTFHALWVEQFTRLRDGDRFWFENDPFFTPQEVAEIRNTTLADVIRRNSAAQVQDDVFHALAPRLQITALTFNRATNTVTLTWRSLPGVHYEIQASDDFSRTVPFASIATVTGSAGATTHSLIDPAAAGKPRRAYRVMQP